MVSDRPLYLMRAAGVIVVAWSPDELMELIGCAISAGDEVEMVHAYYAVARTLNLEELERVAYILHPN